MNAVRHSLLATKVVTNTDEGMQEFCVLQYEMLKDLNPVGAVERLLVDRLTGQGWRLQRTSQIERDILLLKQGGLRGDAVMGYAFLQDAEGPDGLAKLARHEAQIERGFFRTLHELQRIQAARRSGTSPALPAVDIHLDLTAK